MRLTELLRRMHADFRDHLSAIERISQAGGPAEGAKIAHELSLLLKALRAHEWLEEELLYPVLRARDAGGTSAPDSGLSHDALHGRIADLEAALKHPEAGLSLLWAAENFILAFLRHMTHEETDVFAAAERLLPESLLEELGEQALLRLEAQGMPEEYPAAHPG